MQNNQKLEKLNKLIALVQNDTLKPSDVESFLKVISELIQQERLGFQKVSQETLTKIYKTLEKIRESEWIKKN